MGTLLVWQEWKGVSVASRSPSEKVLLSEKSRVTSQADSRMWGPCWSHLSLAQPFFFLNEQSLVFIFTKNRAMCTLQNIWKTEKKHRQAKKKKCNIFYQLYFWVSVDGHFHPSLAICCERPEHMLIASLTVVP